MIKFPDGSKVKIILPKSLDTYMGSLEIGDIYTIIKCLKDFNDCGETHYIYSCQRDKDGTFDEIGDLGLELIINECQKDISKCTCDSRNLL